MSAEISTRPGAAEAAGHSVLGRVVRLGPHALTGALLVVLYATTLRLLGNVWWTDPDYMHGLALPFIVGLIIWTQRRKLASMERRPQLVGGSALVAAALLMQYAGLVGPIHFLQYLSLFVMLLGITLYWGGAALLRPLAAPLALVALSLPLPTVVMNQLAAPLQLAASQFAVWLMKMFQIPLVREGNVIQMLPRGALRIEKLEVVRACSGVRSLFALLFMAVMLVYFTRPARRAAEAATPPWWRRYGFWRALLLCAAAVPIAVLTNSLRVGGTGVLSYYYGLEYATGFFHTFAGVITYGSAAASLLCAGWVLDRARGRVVRRRVQAA